MKTELSRLLPLLALLSLPLTMACPEPAAPDEDPADALDTASIDDLAPTVVATSPEEAASGVPAGVMVQVTFSEPMDTASVALALDASSLGEVVLDWNAEGDSLTIIPADPLPYATGHGNDPAVVTPLTFVVRIDGRATDEAGNALADGLELKFTTLRELSTTFAPVHALTRSLTPTELRYGEETPLVIGDDDADQGIRAALTFDLSPLPDTAQAVISATLATLQLTDEQWGAPYVDLGETALLDHVVFDDLEDENAINGAFNASQDALSTLDAFSEAGQSSIAFDVTAQVTDDLAHRDARADRSQFLLRFETLTDLEGDHDRAVFSRDALELEVTYVAP